MYYITAHDMRMRGADTRERKTEERDENVGIKLKAKS